MVVELWVPFCTQRGEPRWRVMSGHVARAAAGAGRQVKRLGYEETSSAGLGALPMPQS